MGGAVSTGVDNDDLVNNLKAENLISTPIVERVFRAVDRGDYFTPDGREQAYRDHAWKKGNLHLSAPCIYAKVMEALDLVPGKSFLNLGSGTGYLSTMAGLILGPYGVNHGVELHSEVVEFAVQKLQVFKAFDAFTFCYPQFVQGNCLCLSSDIHLYDRVYCGASCPQSYVNYMKALVKVGGILVMPLNDKLVKVVRTTEDHWVTTPLLSVSYASLVLPDSFHPPTTISLPEVIIPELQEICREDIRAILRARLELEHPNLHAVSFLASNRAVSRAPRQVPRRLSPYVLPFYESDVTMSDDENEDGMGNEDGVHAEAFGVDVLFGADQFSAMLELVRSSARQRRRFREREEEDKPGEDKDSATEKEKEEKLDNDEDDKDKESESDASDIDEDANKGAIYCKEFFLKDNVSKQAKDTSYNQGGLINENEITLQPAEDPKELVSLDDVISNITQKFEEELINPASASAVSCIPVSSPIPVTLTPTTSKCSLPSKSSKKREKLDSGIGDEILNGKSNGSGSEESGLDEKCKNENSMDIDSDSDYSDFMMPFTKASRVYGFEKQELWEENSSQENSTKQSKEEDGDGADNSENIFPVMEMYFTHMKEKINQLPLPQALKLYLNYYRQL